MKIFFKYLILILISISVVGVAAYLITLYINNGSDTPTVVQPGDVQENDFKVLYGAEMTFMPEETWQLMLPEEGNFLFKVEGTEDYSIKVVSNLDDGQGGARQYYYFVDGKIGLFSKDDYTDEFILTLSASDYFYIDCHEAGYYDLKNVLSRMYGTSDIELTVPEDMQYPYKMIITSAEGQEVIIELGQIS